MASEEDLIKGRLLIDGDGTGDDRRINLLLKTFFKTCDAPTPELAEESETQALANLASIEYYYKKSRIVSDALKEEIDEFRTSKENIFNEMEKVGGKLGKARQELEAARVLRQQAQEYELLANLIRKHPDRKETHVNLQHVTQQLQSLEEEYGQLMQTIEKKKKQLSVTVTSLGLLHELLDDEKTSSNKSWDPSDSDDCIAI